MIVRSWLCAIFLCMTTNSSAESPATAADLESLSWLVGSWQGDLGPQTVEETWSSPRAGSMEATVRLSSPDGVQMIELIVIREVDIAPGSDEPHLVLHLRQFSPTLDLVNSLEMHLQSTTTGHAVFVAPDSDGIRQLAYRNTAPGQLEAEVTFASGDAVTARLQAVN